MEQRRMKKSVKKALEKRQRASVPRAAVKEITIALDTEVAERLVVERALKDNRVFYHLEVSPRTDLNALWRALQKYLLSNIEYAPARKHTVCKRIKGALILALTNKLRLSALGETEQDQDYDKRSSPPPTTSGKAWAALMSDALNFFEVWQPFGEHLDEHLAALEQAIDVEQAVEQAVENGENTP